MIKTSIRNKLIVLLLLITIVPFGTSIAITYLYTKESLKDKFVEENVNLLYQGKLNIEGYISELQSLTLSFYNNIDFMRYLRNPHQDDDYLAKGSVKNVISTILYANENIDKVNISFVNHFLNVHVSKRSAVIFSPYVEINNENYEKSRNNPTHTYIEPMNILQEGQVSLDNDNQSNGFTFYRALVDSPTDDLLGYISIDINSEVITKISEKLYTKEKEEFYIITPDGEMIFRSNHSIDESEAWIKKLLTTNSSTGRLEWDGDSFKGLMIYDKLSDSHGGWLLVKRIPYTTMFESALSIAKINILFGILGLVLVILATFLVSFKITSPIRVLMQNIKQVEKGNMSVQFDSLGNDEIGVLGERFKEMIIKINQLINREYKLQLENKTNQLKVLQSQLNPHFLYNALQSIGTLALKKNVPQIYNLVTHLSKIMRYGMNTEEDLVPLTKEIDYIKAFLLLQEERFGDKFNYSIQFNKEDLNILVPKMFMQPIIENYFKHGFDSSREEIGKIEISGERDDNQLIIMIRDNGVGMDETRLSEMKQYILDSNQGFSSGGSKIGLKNVYLRLKLYFEDQADFQIQNNVDGGILVTLKLPIEVGGIRDEGDYN